MAAAWRLVGLRLELMLHLLEQAPLRCDQFAQVTDVIAGGNRHQCERTGRRCGAALHPSQRPHFGGWVSCAGLALSMKQCSSLPPFYRKHRFTRQDSQDNEHECSVAFLTLLDNQNVCLLSRVPCLVVAGGMEPSDNRRLNVGLPRNTATPSQLADTGSCVHPYRPN